MSDPVNHSIGLRSQLNRKDVMRLAILCFAVWLHAANSMLAATTLPSAIREIGGGDLISWAFALYLLGSIVSGAATGLLIRSLELRIALMIAAAIYIVGCLLCAMAPDMVTMLAGRLVQGIGGGFLLALTYVSLNRWFDRQLLPYVMALISGVWSASAFCGPLIGGGFSTAGQWRFAFWAFVLQASIFLVITFLLIPKETKKIQKTQKTQTRFPAVRLLLLCLAILSVAFAGTNVNMTTSPALCLLGALLIWFVFWRDAASPGNRMFPSNPLNMSTPVGAGLCFVALASFATMSFLVYGPILLETLHGQTPLLASYIVALESIGWGVAAVYVSSRKNISEKLMIRVGSVMIIAGVLGFAVSLPNGPLAVVIVSATVQGAGFGIMWAFIVKRIIEHAQPGEEDITSTSIPTIKQIGSAFGAAVAGIIANATGFTDEVTLSTAHDVAFWVFAAFLPFGILSIIAAWRLAR